jgi:NADPH:quinone reductase-like Zn-dependent oxidoreductase
MKAIAIDDYGSVDQLQSCERPDPRPHADEVLVRVRAASVNPVDWKIREGQLRLLLHPKFPYIPGGDIAGEVVAAGPEAGSFKAGDAVVGFMDLRRGGGYAEFAAPKAAAVALKPPSLSFIEAATLPIAGCTALRGLRDAGKLTAGASVLILGGAGGVGHFTVQISKALGAKTTATCGPSNIDFVRSLGADRVICYTTTDVMAQPDRYDLVFDTVATSSFPACRQILAPGGIYVTTLPGPGLLFWSAVQSIAGIFGKAKRAKMVVVRPNGRDIAFLCALARDGKLKPHISLTLPLDRAAEAQQASKAGHSRGKIVLEC